MSTKKLVASHEGPLVVSGPELHPPELATLGDRPGAQIADPAADQHVAVGRELGPDPDPTGAGEVIRHDDGLATVPAEELDRPVAAQGQPLPVRAESRAVIHVRWHRREQEGGRRGLQHAQGEAPRLLRVGQLQALDGIGEGGRGMSLLLGLTQGEQLAGLRAEGFGVGLPARGSRCGSRTSPARRGRRPSPPRPQPPRSAGVVSVDWRGRSWPARSPLPATTGGPGSGSATPGSRRTTRRSRAGPGWRPRSFQRCAACRSWSRSCAPSASCVCHRTSRGQCVSSDS